MRIFPWLIAAFIALSVAPAKAQETVTVTDCSLAGTIYAAGQSGRPIIIDLTGKQCVASSGGGGAATIADGADITQGTTTDAACATDNGTCTEIALLKRANQRLTTAITSIGGSNAYETVAASQTAQSLGATGATGDYLSHCVVTPGTTSPGVVTILDNATSVVAFPGGASSVSNLVPFAIPVGAVSVSGAWKITTGANVTVVCMGRFT